MMKLLIQKINYAILSSLLFLSIEVIEENVVIIYDLHNTYRNISGGHVQNRRKRRMMVRVQSKAAYMYTIPCLIQGC